MSDQDALIAEAVLGDEAKKFKESDLYRYMLGVADQEIIAAQEALMSVNPDDPSAIRDLQFKAKVAGQFRQWLDEAIDIGDSAVEVFREQTK